MKTRLAATAILLSIGAPAPAHRLDEYLQATLISVEQNRVHAQIRLTPGVAVFPFVLAIIDTNADGVISESEQRVSMFSLEGETLGRFGVPGDAPGQFRDHPHGLCVDSHGDVYVAEVAMSGGGRTGLVPASCHTFQKFVRET